MSMIAFASLDVAGIVASVLLVLNAVVKLHQVMLTQQTSVCFDLLNKAGMIWEIMLVST